MTERWGRQGTLVALVLVAAPLVVLPACQKGVGDSCQANADCVSGLSCLSGQCEPCTDTKGDVQACIPIDLVVRGCDTATNPLDGAKFLRITVSGDGLSPSVVSTEDVSAKAAVLPGLPFGKNRRILVEAVAQKDDALPIARGESAPFDVTAADPLPSITVFLRQAQAFTKTSTRAEPTVCAGLHDQRAGHTATTLKDGRVLVVGGYQYDQSGKRSYLDTAEIYDPREGSFRVVTSHLAIGRAFHTATLLPDGRVLVAGGTRFNASSGHPEPLQVAELFDPSTETFTPVAMKHPRSHHAAAMLPDGIVLLSGGYFNAPLETDSCDDIPCAAVRYPTDTTEYFDPRQPLAQAFQEGPRMGSGTDIHTRADQASVALDGERIAVLGGTDGNGPLSSVDVFHYVGGDAGFILETPATFTLGGGGRANPLAMLMNAGGTHTGVLVTGAPADGGTATDEAWDWLVTSDGGSDPGKDVVTFPSARTEACMAAFDGGLLVAGGRDPSGAILGSADSFTIDTQGKVKSSVAGQLATPVAHPACASLEDGTVLVVGGETAANAVTADAEVFEPEP